MPVEVTPRAIEVLRRAFELGRMDPESVGVRLSVARGLRGEEIRTGFVEEPEASEMTIDAGGIRIYVPRELGERDIVATIDVADEHDRIVLR